MVIKRKTKAIDAVDRAILKQMYITKRNLSGNQLAKSIRLSPSAIAPRLNSLRAKGIIKPTKILGMRKLDRKFGTGIKKIRAPRSILWGFNIKKSKKRR